jgi:hypothetical protein
MRRIHRFVWGHVIAALVIGAAAGSFLDWQAVAAFSALMAVNAVISSLICWWWPGFSAAWWKLWPMAALINPLMVAAIAWSLEHWDCLISRRGGWSCMLDDVGLWVAAACLPSPLIGLAARWWRGRRIA